MKISNKLKAFIVMICFFYSIYGFRLIFDLLNVDRTLLSNKAILYVDAANSLITIVVFLFLYKDFIYEHLNKTFIKSKITRIATEILIGFGIFFGVKYVSAMVETTIFTLFNIKNTTVANQAAIEDYLQYGKIIMFISLAILAPFVEEFVFRGAFKEGIKNKKVFIAVSGLIFGLMHVMSDYTVLFGIFFAGLYLDYIFETKSGKSRVWSSLAGVLLISLFVGGILYLNYGNLLILIKNLDLVEVIGSITYVTMGIFLAYYYAKHENIYINIGLHSLNNIFSYVVLLLI